MKTSKAEFVNTAMEFMDKVVDMAEEMGLSQTMLLSTCSYIFFEGVSFLLSDPEYHEEASKILNAVLSTAKESTPSSYALLVKFVNDIEKGG
jgi:hypothetical protein